MPLPENFVEAVYIDPGLERYRDNPLIEALPPIMDLSALKKKLAGKITFNPQDCFEKGHIRVHQISALLDDFFQPLSMHKQLDGLISLRRVKFPRHLILNDYFLNSLRGGKPPDYVKLRQVKDLNDRLGTDHGKL
ncbi:Transposon Tn7 transposition protein TnsC [Pseudovibrio sp. Ad14]|nr:Transposon Tn7 transposition protein TnsC [Pseudovibrio sp. W74]KZL05255.1 Transposon Tn7 transposition protein TnsC [Pseudovibrio sp. Ad14]